MVGEARSLCSSSTEDRLAGEVNDRPVGVGAEQCGFARCPDNVGQLGVKRVAISAPVGAARCSLTVNHVCPA